MTIFFFDHASHPPNIQCAFIHSVCICLESLLFFMQLEVTIYHIVHCVLYAGDSLAF